MQPERPRDVCSCGRHVFRRIGSYYVVVEPHGVDPIPAHRIPQRCLAELSLDRYGVRG